MLISSAFEDFNLVPQVTQDIIHINFITGFVSGLWLGSYLPLYMEFIHNLVIEELQGQTVPQRL